MVRAFNKARKNNRLYVRLSAPTPARSSRASRWRRCPPRCWRSSTPIAAAAPSARCAARRLANGTSPTELRRQRRAVPLPAARRQLSRGRFVDPDSMRPLLGLLIVCALTLPLHGPPAPVSGKWPTQADFLKGDVDQPVHRPARPAGARPLPHRARERPQRRFSGRGAAGTDGSLLVGYGQRRPGSARRARWRVTPSSTRPNSKSTPSRAGPAASSTWARRRTEDLQGRCGRQVRAVLRSRRQVHLGAGSGLQRRGLRGHGRQGPDLPHHARRHGRGLLSHQGHACDARCTSPRAAVLAGTESPGRVFRVTRDGAGFLLLDSGLQEVSALRPGPSGVVYAAALTGRQRGSPRRTGGLAGAARGRCPCRRSRPRSLDGRGRTRRAHGAAVRAARRANRDAPAAKGPSIASQADGAWDQVWDVDRGRPLRRRPRRQRRAAGRHGSKGKIYRVAGDPAQTTLLARASAQQVTTVIADGDRGVLLATANPAKVSVCRHGLPRRGRTNPRSATPTRWRRGAQSLARDAPAGTAVDCSRARATRRPQTTRGAPGRRRTAIPTANRSPVRRRATSSGRSSWSARHAHAGA